MDDQSGDAAPILPNKKRDSDNAAPSGKWLRRLNYLYFMRFSLLLWLSMPALALLDAGGGESATRGIVALGDPWQLFFASFFVAINGWIALLSARIVCAYGAERFLTPPPPGFAVDETMSARTFWLAQVPGFSLLGYVAYRSHQEEYLGYFFIILMFLCGLAIALLCWVLMAGIYYWLFWTKDPRNIEKPTDDSPTAFLVPYASFFKPLLQREPSAFLLVLLEIGKIPAMLGPGYRKAGRKFNPLHSGHVLAFLALGFILTIYGVFSDFTSPILIEKLHKSVIGGIITVALLWIVFAALYHFFVLKKRSDGRTLNYQNLALMVLLFAPMLLVCSLPFMWKHSDVMPVLASVSVLLLFVIWALSALAFFFDRFRVPVSIFLFLLFLVVNVLTGSGILPLPSDHSVQLAHTPPEPETYAGKLQDKNSLQTPKQIYDSFEQGKMQDQKGLRPVIVVTATGGGIHAAAWTSRVLAMLESEFSKAGLPPFHNSLLLMSTVSGGSVGSVPWAAEYLKVEGAFSKASVDGMPLVAECSELQAVAWGLTYADFIRALYPYRHFFLSPDLDTYDRGWALQQGFWRNRHYPLCKTEKLPVGGTEETLGDLAWKARSAPAFSFNTTIAETGNRFLGANYILPNQYGEKSEIIPADSFLRIYGRDLPLSSAARLSANFPYVSPMPRVPMVGSHYHFGDGGYFDNDGTATAMEFLWYALKRPETEMDGGQKEKRQPPVPSTDGKKNMSPIPVLLIEIRDGNDINAKGREEVLPQMDPKDHEEAKDWGIAGQLSGPLLTFWNADHVSVTKRNRRELCFLENALSTRANVTHVVFAYEGNPDEVQPLSWHLTKKQKDAIFDALKKTGSSTDKAVHWYRDALKHDDASSQNNEIPPIPPEDCSHL